MQAVASVPNPTKISTNPLASLRQTLTNNHHNLNRDMMFCSRCLRTTVARRTIVAGRQLSTSRALLSAEPAISTPTTNPGEPAQPRPAARSSCPEGTVLSGLNYMKGKEDPRALKDEDYPEWLWSCLDVMKKAEAADENAGDEFCK